MSAWTLALYARRLLEEFAQGINARKHQSLAKVSKPTATRDLAELLEKGCHFKLPGGGRSTRYSVLLGELSNSQPGDA